MVDGVSLNEQMKDLDFYKMIQKERSITSKHTIDEYRMDIAKRLIDESIKKQAIEVVNLIESQLEENQKLEDEEEEDEYEGEVDYVSVEDYVESVEENNTVEEPKVYEIPEYQMTEEEQAAIDEMAKFNNDNSPFKDLESANLEHTRASFKESNHLNLAKQGFKAIKQDIDTKVKEIDVEKLDEQFQTFGIVILGILNGIRSFLGKAAIALYKVPAKRAQKKNLDYSLKEANGAFKGKSITELGEEAGLEMFKLEWGPKIVLLLSSVLIYNNFWKMGGITLAIGLIYYLVTYFSYDYGGSKMLNVLANYMDSQGIRLKDAYYTNMIVLYRYFNEYQSDMNVSIDESGPIEIVEDPELGSILKFYVNEDKNTIISSITDHRLNYFKVVPFLDSYNLKAKLQEKRQVAVMLDQILLMAIKKDDDIAELYSQKEEYWDYFAELKGLAEQKQAIENARLQQIEDEKFFEDMQKKKLSERAINIIKFLKQEKDNLGMSPHDLNQKGIKGNEDYLKVRMLLNQGTTYAQAKGKLAYIGSKTGLIPKIIEIPSTDSAIYLMFYLNKSLKSRPMTMKEIKAEGEKGIFTLGKGYLGDYTTEIPRQDQPFFVLVGGLARSGKSTLASRLLVNTTYLQDENGVYDYQDYFISSVKDEDYTANGFKQSGMYVTGSPEETYSMLVLVDKLATERKQIFLDNDVINIKQYNKKFPENKMGKIMVVMDEYANLFRACGSRKIETENGKMKLKDAIEERLVKINAEHGSRGVSSIVITQNFMKEEVGKVRDTIGCKILGNAESNVWSSYDNTGQISKILQSKSEENQGVFLMNISSFQTVKGVEKDVVQGFVETKTHFIDTDDIRKGFDRTYKTTEKYAALISAGEESVEEEEETINNLEVEKAEADFKL